MSERVAIIGAGWAGFRPSTPEQSYKEMIYAAAVRAYSAAGVQPRRDVESFVTVAEDFHEGTSIFDEYTPDQLGAALKPVHTITGDGLHGLATAYMLIRTGQFDRWPRKDTAKPPISAACPGSPPMPRTRCSTAPCASTRISSPGWK